MLLYSILNYIVNVTVWYIQLIVNVTVAMFGSDTENFCKGTLFFHVNEKKIKAM